MKPKNFDVRVCATGVMLQIGLRHPRFDLDNRSTVQGLVLGASERGVILLVDGKPVAFKAKHVRWAKPFVPGDGAEHRDAYFSPGQMTDHIRKSPYRPLDMLT